MEIRVLWRSKGAFPRIIYTHSVWQITIVAVLFGLILLLFKQSSAAAKYYLSVGAMSVVFLISVSTFINEYSGSGFQQNNKSNINAAGLTININKNVVDNKPQILKPGIKDQLKALLNNNMMIVVGLWDICVLLLLFKMVGGLIYSQRLKNWGTVKLSTYWEKKIDQLSHSVGINKAIAILESTLARTPMVIGYFKPVILLPIGLVTGLSPKQVEAILMHELAHIKRNDYLVNIFLNLIEVLFFFHPGIWWISKKVRTERENACDDMAIQQNINRLELAKALANIEILNHSTPEFALAINGNQKSLTNRIKRMTTKPTTRYTLKEGIISAGVLFICLFAMAFTSNNLSTSNEGEITTANITDPSLNQVDSENNVLPFKAQKNKIEVESIISDKLFKSPLYDTIDSIEKKIEMSFSVKSTNYKLGFDSYKKVMPISTYSNEIKQINWKDYTKPIGGILRYGIDFESTIGNNNQEKTSPEKSEIKLFDDTIVTINQEREILYKVNNTTNYRILFDENREIEQFFFNGNQIPKAYWKDYQRPIDEMLEIFQAYLTKKQGRDEKTNIINELITEMKNEGLIDKNAIGYKVHFVDNNLIINDIRQPDEVFQKYKKLFDDKSQGKFKLDTKLNVNPNYYKKSPKEVLEMQVEYNKEREQKLQQREQELKKKEAELKNREAELKKHEEELQEKVKNN